VLICSEQTPRQKTEIFTEFPAFLRVLIYINAICQAQNLFLNGVEEPMEKTYSNRWGWLFLSLVVIFIDQLTKWLVLRYLTIADPQPVWPFLQLSLIYNPGIAFSLLSFSTGWARWLLALVTLVISMGLLIAFFKVKLRRREMQLGLAFVLGGAIGNLIDRIRLGYVIDFIDIYIKHWHWPIFNVADIAVTVGVMWLLLMFLFEKPGLRSG
jgi:signal peptidase II